MHLEGWSEVRVMFGILNIGGWELLVIFVLALVIFGPGKLPEVAKTMGKGFLELRKATISIQRMINEATIEEERVSSSPKENTAQAKSQEKALADSK